jgi:phosphoglycerate dehydrogenase-like enzyme
MTRLLAYEPAYARIADRLAALAPDLEVVVMHPDGKLTVAGAPVEGADAQPDIVWMSVDIFAGPNRDFWITALKSQALKWVQSNAAGYDAPGYAKLVEKGAVLTTSDAQSISIAEYVLAGVLDHYQRGPERRADQAAHRWTQRPFREIAGSRWLIVGFGSIGQATAERARAFGAQVTGVRRRAGDHPFADRMIPNAGLAGALPDADVVLPLSPETASMVDADFLAAMKPGSILVNIGRGGLVDEAALLAALDAGKPEHAILDVFQQEPQPEDGPFWDHPRVVLTGHAAAVGSGRSGRADDFFLENLRRFRAGEPLLNVAPAEAVLAGR